MIRRLMLMLACVAVAGGPARAQEVGLAGGEVRDLTGGGKAFVEVVAGATETFVGVPVEVTVRWGIEAGFAAKEQAPLFQRTLDQSVQVTTDWLGESPWRLVEPETAKALTFALEGEVAKAVALGTEERGGAQFGVWGFRARLVPEAAGELRLARTELKLALATEWTDDLLRGRTPVHVVEGIVRGAPLTLRVLALPEKDRPPQFGGAVGRFTISAEATPREVEVGGTLQLVVTIEGEGNFETFAAPDVARLDGFRLLGQREERDAGRFRLEAELSVASPRVREVPPVEFAWFDPNGTGQYVMESTAPLPLRVSAPKTADPMTPATLPFDIPVGPAPEANINVALWAGVLLAVIVLVVLLLRARRKLTMSSGEEQAKSADFELGLIRPGGDVTRLYPAYLAARLDCDVAEVAREDFAARLEKAGAPAELAKRATELARTFAAATYGPKAPKEIIERARATVRELDRVHFRV
ncbi:MAG: hypothetical protein NTV21_13385 [Planctomycetota bacterium]|nr:hypothetical protein [Planctomycetota bacterium]